MVHIQLKMCYILFRYWLFLWFLFNNNNKRICYVIMYTKIFCVDTENSIWRKQLNSFANNCTFLVQLFILKKKIAWTEIVWKLDFSTELGSSSTNYIGIVVLDFLSDFHIQFIQVCNMIHLVAGWIDLEKILPGPLWAGTKHSIPKKYLGGSFHIYLFLVWI